MDFGQMNCTSRSRERIGEGLKLGIPFIVGGCPENSNRTKVECRTDHEGVGMIVWGAAHSGRGL